MTSHPEVSQYSWNVLFLAQPDTRSRSGLYFYTLKLSKSELRTFPHVNLIIENYYSEFEFCPSIFKIKCIFPIF